MRKLSLIAASFVALGWSAANADTGSTTVTTPGATIKAPAGSSTSITGPSDTTAPGATVTAPSGATTTITPPSATATTPSTGDTTTATPAPSDTTGTPSDTTTATPGEQPPTTNVEINTPPPVNNTVVTPVPVQPAPAPVQDNRYVERTYGPQHYAPAVGAGILVGGGFQDFSRDNARSVTQGGGYWNARLIFGTRQFLGFEAAYVGSAQSISALGLSNDAVLVSNGAEGALRLNLPIMAREALIEPFAFGGAGWSRFHIANSAVNTSSVATNDDVLQIPYGGGVAFGYRGFMADARFTYRSTFYNDLLRGAGGGNLDNWSVGGQLGFEF
jgi:hypothetical protein